MLELFVIRLQRFALQPGHLYLDCLPRLMLYYIPGFSIVKQLLSENFHLPTVSLSRFFKRTNKHAVLPIFANHEHLKLCITTMSADVTPTGVSVDFRLKKMEQNASPDKLSVTTVFSLFSMKELKFKQFKDLLLFTTIIQKLNWKVKSGKGWNLPRLPCFYFLSPDPVYMSGQAKKKERSIWAGKRS
jgi:hypothetical protein